MKIKEFKLERFFARYEFSAPYLLCSSDCESFTVKELLQLKENSEEELKNLWLGYTESQGSPILRKEISRLYEKTGPEEIIVFAGAQEGIFIFMNVLLNKGDHIIVQFPAYQSLFEIANSIGCEITRWEMKHEDKWELNINFLEENIKKNTKLIVINTPHNPTGYSIPPEKYRKIIDLAKKNDIHIFSDEVYKFLEYDEKTRLPAMCDLYDKGFSLGVMSKAFGLAGLRVGWIGTRDKEILLKLASFKDFTSICNSVPGEFLSALALRNKEIILKRNMKIIKNNLILLDEFFDKYSTLFEWVRPKASSIAFPRIKFNKNAEDFCMELVKEKGVLLLPGTKYDFGDKHFRTGFGRKNMAEALKKLEEYIRDNLL